MVLITLLSMSRIRTRTGVDRQLLLTRSGCDRYHGYLQIQIPHAGAILRHHECQGAPTSNNELRRNSR